MLVCACAVTSWESRDKGLGLEGSQHPGPMAAAFPSPLLGPDSGQREKDLVHFHRSRQYPSFPNISDDRVTLPFQHKCQGPPQAKVIHLNPNPSILAL